jgi:lipoprotein-releasing system permease protein
VKSRLELFIAARYLRAKRKEAVISVITAISVLGVAAGVMALVIALAVNNGFHDTLEKNLLGAMAHVNVMPQRPGDGIEQWREVAEKLRKVPHVTAVSPALYDGVYMIGPLQSAGVELKGIEVDRDLAMSETLRHLKAGSLDRLRDPDANPPGIILGARLAEDLGMVVNANIEVVIPNAGELTPFGIASATRRFRVAGIFETGFFDVDDHWAFTSLNAAQRFMKTGDLVNQIELNVDNLSRTTQIAKDVERAAGSNFTTLTWMERNKQILGALKMERVVTIITIGLIELVAALNIFITLVMMVMEKYRDIAVLVSMGARRSQVRWIFMLQGVLIGITGSVLGLIAGYTLCYFADKYHWVRLDQSVYALPYVPFQPRPLDGIWIAAAAVLVSFLATVYPARNATRIAPAEVLRYE